MGCRARSVRARGAGVVLALAVGCVGAPSSRVDGAVLVTGDDALRFALRAPGQGATRFDLGGGRAWKVDEDDRLMVVLGDGDPPDCSDPVVARPGGGVAVVITGDGPAAGFSEALYAGSEAGPPGVVSFLRDVRLEATVEPPNPDDPPSVRGRVLGQAAFGYYQEPAARAHPVIPSPGLHNQRLRFDVPLCGRL